MKNIFKFIYSPNKEKAEEIFAESIKAKKKNIGIIFTIISIITVVNTFLLFNSPFAIFFDASNSNLILDILLGISYLTIFIFIFAGLLFGMAKLFNKNKKTEEYIQKSGEKVSFLNSLLASSICMFFVEIIFFIIFTIVFAYPTAMFFAPILALVLIIWTLNLFAKLFSSLLENYVANLIMIIIIIGVMYWMYQEVTYENKSFENLKIEEMEV